MWKIITLPNGRIDFCDNRNRNFNCFKNLTETPIKSLDEQIVYLTRTGLFFSPFIQKLSINTNYLLKRSQYIYILKIIRLKNANASIQCYNYFLLNFKQKNKLIFIKYFTLFLFLSGFSDWEKYIEFQKMPSKQFRNATRKILTIFW